MNRLLNIVAVVLLVGWVIGAFVFTIGKIIHILLVLAMIALLLRFIRRKQF